ncbi:MAG: rod shape-determining protein MreC [Luteimonas sp.]
MSSYAGPAAPRPGDVAGTLRLLAYLALAITLMVLDHRGGWLRQMRDRAELLAQPLWWVAGLPGRIGDSVRDDAATRALLAEDNRKLRNALLIGGARMARLQAAAAENARLRGLLGAAQRGRLDVQLAPILNIDLDPTRQRLILGAGERDGVNVGQTVIDAGGVLGQIIDVKPLTSTVLLLTDPDHAIPVAIMRSGVRLVVYGRGDRLLLTNIPLSSDTRVGDVLVTSGIGGRFPAGFPVGTITTLRPDESRAFLVGDLRPAGRLDRGNEVLLLRVVTDAPEPAMGAMGPDAAAGPGVDPGRGNPPDTASADAATSSTRTPGTRSRPKAPVAEPQAPIR